MNDFEDIKNLYEGFWIEEPVGNNAFSYRDRQNRRIHVPPLVSGRIEDVAQGDAPAFVEISDGKEIVCPGLKNFIRTSWKDTDVFIFDNHNHALCFWAYGKAAGKIPDQAVLVHVDQHKDTRQPQGDPPDMKDLKEVFDYTNQVLNVGNFIIPAKEAGLFGEIVQVNGLAHMNDVRHRRPFVLDIDLDWFAEDMDYIPWDQKCEFLRQCLEGACFVTVATSPYFIDFNRALMAMKNIFSLE